MVVAIVRGEPKRCTDPVTSRKASSIEMRSTRREIVENLDDPIAETLVLVEMAANEPQTGTQLPRAPARHTARDAKGLGLVRRRENDPATHGDGKTPQLRIEQLLHGGVERVEVRVQDRRGAGGHDERP